MTREAIKRLWRAKTRPEATLAINEIEHCLEFDPDTISTIEFETVKDLIRAKGRTLSY